MMISSCELAIHIAITSPFDHPVVPTGTANKTNARSRTHDSNSGQVYAPQTETNGRRPNRVLLRTRTRKGWFDLPKSSFFGEHGINVANNKLRNFAPTTRRKSWHT